MFEIIKIYPLIFLCTVILPIIGGLVGGYIGLDALKSRHKDSINKQEIKDSISAIDSKLEPITSQIAVIERYEKKLSSHNQKDKVLSAVLAKYKQMKKATEDFHRFRGVESEIDRGKLAEHILSTIANNLIPVAEVPNLPGRPLIISLGANTFKVVFSVPMRIPPQLEFQGLLEGVSAQVSENTTFGFIVQFLPAETPVSNFGFTASAEL